MPYLDKLNLIDAMHSMPSSMSVCMNTDECFGMMRMKQMMMHLVSSLPEAQVDPVRHGRWISEPGHIPHCSECGRYSDDADTGEAICCPFCGARMDGEIR